jgi:hypothetical protein
VFPPVRDSLLLTLLGMAVATGGLAGSAGHAQMLLDAAGAGSVQGILQQQGGAGYGQVLDKIRQRLSNESGATLRNPQSAAGSGSSSTPPVDTSGAAVAAPTTGSDPVFWINDQPVLLCSSGFPCLGAIQRAMGLNGRSRNRAWRH